MIYRLGLLTGCLVALAIVGGAALHRSQGKAPHEGGKVCPRVEVEDLCLCGPHRVVPAERPIRAATQRGAREPYTRFHPSWVTLAGLESLPDSPRRKADLPPHGSRPLDPSRTQAVVDAYIRAEKAARP